ncbi:MAG: hypothetical protein QOI09_1453 [Chloroflexota bacterium]|nr:hypothetical protein [Chloroflexota bacterium]
MTTDEEEAAETLGHVNRLRVATRHRHSLATGTPEYDAAVLAEERLVLALWHRGDAVRKASPPPSS